MNVFHNQLLFNQVLNAKKTFTSKLQIEAAVKNKGGGEGGGTIGEHKNDGEQRICF